MKINKTGIEGVLLIEPDVYEDPRGFFMETWRHEKYSSVGINATFAQDNLSYSEKGVLRGLHLQIPNAQAKLVQALVGEIFDVAVDLRRGSPTFGQWISAKLSADNKHQFFIPEGCAHGFCVTSPTALVSYKCSKPYRPESEKALLWNDPDIGIKWPVENPLVSEKDSVGLLLKDF